ncbi:uncharacterized protein LOC134259114 [Saccostrea cucullata]|uniref:uncharacterized protein LOC134259114 n=1 Tax=Saccostrea cuccullata TaxID=36930 RepID=UPI002ED475DC
MTTGYGYPLPRNHWIQFDSHDQVTYGLVLNESAVRNEVLLVVAVDSYEKRELTKDILCFFLPGFRITKFEHFIQNHSLVEEATDILWIPFKSDINLWFEIVLPVIILLSILIVLVVIVYVCCTRRRKLYLLHSEKPTFLEERRPVIFQTEAPVEDPSLCPRNPAILSRDNELSSSEVDLIDQRSLPSTPDYNPFSTIPPPVYRVPPPYTNNHQYW